MKVTGGDGSDFLFGFAMHDEISGGAGGDVITGHMGVWNDKELTMSGAVAGDLLDGGDGGDWIWASEGADRIIGGGGNDLINSCEGEDIITGDAGNDVLAGGSDTDTLSGGDGDDMLLGDGYFTSSLWVNVYNLPSFGVDLTASAAGYYTGYVSRNFSIENDAPDSGRPAFFELC
jgi:Ca2+-binding RTX toxin-like protein